MQDSGDANDLVRRHDQTLEAARRLRSVAETLGRANARKPEEVRADAFSWRENDGSYAEISALPTKVAYGIFTESGRPQYVGTAATADEVTNISAEFAKELRSWQDARR